MDINEFIDPTVDVISCPTLYKKRLKTLSILQQTFKVFIYSPEDDRKLKKSSILQINFECTNLLYSR